MLDTLRNSLVRLLAALFVGPLAGLPANADEAAQSASHSGADRLKVLILDGQNNHRWWPETTAFMKDILERTGRFDVKVARTKYTWKGDDHLPEYDLPGVETEPVEEPKPDPNFKPDFAAYDAVISNFGWKAAAWPEETQAAFEKYVRDGGGFVCVHAADNSFPAWKAYNDMIGLGGWGGRTEKDGPYVYYKDGELVVDDSAGEGGHHGPRHAYPVVVRDRQHPITRGMPTEWMHQIDELYDSLRGPAKQMQILATSFADPANGGSGRDEPVAMVISYGDGNVFHTVLGDDVRAMECIGFQALLSRGVEWAATGEVTLPIPDGFPSPSDVSLREFEAGAAVLEDAAAN